jgi:hypothetical protein
MEKHRSTLIETLVVCSLLIAGCASVQTSRGRLRTTADSWAMVKNAAADAWQAGELDREEKKQVLRVTRRGDRALAEWREAVEEGGNVEGARKAVQRATDILRDVWLQSREAENE